MRETTQRLASGALRAALAATAVLWTVVATASLGAAQTFPPPGAQPPPQGRPPAQPQPKPQAKKPAPDASAPAGGGESSLRQRVEQLEEQLVDLQVVIGTLESLARSGGPATASTAYRGGVPASSGGSLSGPDAGRIAALETQVQALSAQIEQMGEQIRALRAGTGAGVGPPPQVGGFRAAGPPPGPGPGGFATTTTTLPPGGGRAAGGDPIGNIIGGPPADPRAGVGEAPGRMAALPPASSPAARQQYESAYGLLLQQNYPAAETGFNDFLARFPNDEMAPNAQFWLGETYFVRGMWDNAAAAFLKVAQNYARSDKAPDSLAKFAMSMERKGNKPAACRALNELNSRYPNAPAHVRNWEATERRRAGCG